MFSMARRLLFLLPPERAHDLTLGALDWLEATKASRLLPTRIDNPHSLWGIQFPNAVGLAAGLDKNADHVAGLAALGFGFLELGTVTPRAQPGNPAPRLFRLPSHDALINRMGFNNKGVDHLCERLRAIRASLSIPIGVNIGKNRDTPLTGAIDDYRHNLAAVYSVADYVAVNLSSPNTPGLRDLQEGQALIDLVRQLKIEQKKQSRANGHYVPLVVKIAPDLTPEALHTLVDVLLGEAIDGVIATNTTLSRAGVAKASHAEESGGLSGAPLREQATAVVRQIRRQAGPDWPIIAAGGITKASDAAEKIHAGANLCQLYTGLIFQGPSLVRKAAQAVCEINDENSSLS
jgi:dihydroorotate dehydrogenase